MINTEYGLNYYWVGKVCHVGSVENDLSTSGNYGDKYLIKQGRNEALLSISKENTNAKIVDMITGYGSSNNIPYYYPNKDPYGEAIFTTRYLRQDSVEISLQEVWKWCSGAYNNRFLYYKRDQESYSTNIIGLSKTYTMAIGGIDTTDSSYRDVPQLANSVSENTVSTNIGYIQYRTPAGMATGKRVNSGM